MKNEIWTIIGGGNGGQTFAGHIALLGKRVRLYSKSSEKCDQLNRKGKIVLHHAIEGEGKIEFATTDMAKAMNKATHIVMVLPSNWHEQTVKAMVPFLEDGQNILILPEASCGAIAFKKILKEEGCNAKLIIGAASTLPYATRAVRPGECHVSGVKEMVKIAALPASDNDKLAMAFCPSFSCFQICENVIETSLDNNNALMHPAPVILNISRFEALGPNAYEYYHEGFTPSVGALLEQMDKERIAVAEAYGVKQRTLKRQLCEMYSVDGTGLALYEVVKAVGGYRGIMNPVSVRERYITEDIPYSLVSISTLGRIAQVPTPCIDAVCELGKGILGKELDEGRTIEQLGLNEMSKQEFIEYIEGIDNGI